MEAAERLVSPGAASGRGYDLGGPATETRTATMPTTFAAAAATPGAATAAIGKQHGVHAAVDTPVTHAAPRHRHAAREIQPEHTLWADTVEQEDEDALAAQMTADAKLAEQLAEEDLQAMLSWSNWRLLTRDTLVRTQNTHWGWLKPWRVGEWEGVAMELAEDTERFAYGYANRCAPLPPYARKTATPPAEGHTPLPAHELSLIHI